jgi:hypothetical protein
LIESRLFDSLPIERSQPRLSPESPALQQH